KRGGILKVNASRREHRSYSSLIGNAVMNSGEFLMPLWGVTFKKIMCPLDKGDFRGLHPPCAPRHPSEEGVFKRPIPGQAMILETKPSADIARLRASQLRPVPWVGADSMSSTGERLRAKRFSKRICHLPCE